MFFHDVPGLAGMDGWKAAAGRCGPLCSFDKSLEIKFWPESEYR
jgi:hypothetical protein